MVGNAQDAKRALTGELTYLGEGCTRVVYISDDKTVVYKVERHDLEIDHTSNADEIEAITSLTGKLETGYALPKARLFANGVLAMEYIDGDYLGECYCVGGEEHYACLTSEQESYLSTFGLDALTWGNTCRRDGVIYLIDLGH